MTGCDICCDVELESRCPKCGRLPPNTQLAALTEAFDCLDVMKEWTNGAVAPEVYSCLKTLTGVVKRLVVENKKLKEELHRIREGASLQ
jgi:hypothetical protein